MNDVIEEMTKALQLIATAALILRELIDGEGTQDEAEAATAEAASAVRRVTNRLCN